MKKIKDLKEWQKCCVCWTHDNLTHHHIKNGKSKTIYMCRQCHTWFHMKNPTVWNWNRLQVFIKELNLKRYFIYKGKREAFIKNLSSEGV